MQGLGRLEELVRKLVDLVENRVEANLQAIRDTMLVELPADRYKSCAIAAIKIRIRLLLKFSSPVQSPCHMHMA